MAGDLALKFVPPPEDNEADLRTMQVKQVNEGSGELTDIYKFHHPVIVGLSTGVTTFHRMNFETHLWEAAGHIEWSSNRSAFIYFGTERVPLRELRKVKKNGSSSRRFKVNGAEYKWKVADNGVDLVCLSTQFSSYGKNVAEWSQENMTLRVSDRVEGILDRIVVTCILNMWMKHNNSW